MTSTARLTRARAEFSIARAVAVRQAASRSRHNVTRPIPRRASCSNVLVPGVEIDSPALTLGGWAASPFRPGEGTQIAPRLRPPCSRSPTLGDLGWTGRRPRDPATRPENGSTMGQTACAEHRTSRPTTAGAARLPVSQTGRVEGHPEADRPAINLRFCRNFANGAAQESNLPTVGLPRPAGFEDGTDLAQRSHPEGVCAPERALRERSGGAAPCARAARE
jgi:hypothetical protein